jgi:hypothetical protein
VRISTDEEYDGAHRREKTEEYEAKKKKAESDGSVPPNLTIATKMRCLSST